MHTHGVLVALVLAGCALSNPDDSSVGAGKADAGDTAIVDCNDGAMTIEPSTTRAGQWVATIHDPGVVDWLIAQSQTTYTTTVEYSGQTASVTVQRALPWMVTVEGEGAARRMNIRDLRAYADGFRSSGRGGVTIDEEGEGLRLKIDGMTMVSSHIPVYYEVGQWGFESCVTVADEGAPDA